MDITVLSSGYWGRKVNFAGWGLVLLSSLILLLGTGYCLGKLGILKDLKQYHYCITIF